MARANEVDLVEVAPNATPPVCRLVDYGRFRYEQAKRDKESKKHQHANRVKEIQLTATIDNHDFAIKLGHAIDFLCDDMKVKANLRFRGREMAHTEFGFQVVQRFIQALALFGHPDSDPKRVGRSINVMFTPLPRNKRAKNPNQGVVGSQVQHPGDDSPNADLPVLVPPGSSPKPAGFANSPFAGLDDRVSSG
jgi:translation initiation factor IF-3